MALMPTVVVQDELKSGKLAESCVVPGLFENFYAITVKRHFERPLVKKVLEQPEAEVLGLIA
jgi:LysR family transcriptional activator of nhaA